VTVDLARLAVSVALCFVSAAVASGADDLPGPEKSTTTDVRAKVGALTVINDTTFSEIRVGSSTKAQVRELLGAPWRTAMFADDADDEDAHEIWEYRGRDTTGPCKVHIEFDGNGITRLAVKVQDRTGDNGPRKGQ